MKADAAEIDRVTHPRGGWHRTPPLRNRRHARRRMTPNPSTVFFERATEERRSIGRRAVALVQHVFKLLLGGSLESDEFHSISIVLFPSNDAERNHDRGAGAGRLDSKTERCADGQLHVAFDLAAADGQVSQQAGSVRDVARERRFIINRHTRVRSWFHPSGAAGLYGVSAPPRTDRVGFPPRG